MYLRLESKGRRYLPELGSTTTASIAFPVVAGWGEGVEVELFTPFAHIIQKCIHPQLLAQTQQKKKKMVWKLAFDIQSGCFQKEQRSYVGRKNVFF